MSVKILLIIVAGCLLSFPARAAGLVTVTGKLVSITETQYVVETAKSTYAIRRGAIPRAQAEKLTRTEVPVTLSVSFEGIDSVKPRLKRQTASR